jgi:hypothetical protein
MGIGKMMCFVYINVMWFVCVCVCVFVCLLTCLLLSEQYLKSEIDEHQMVIIAEQKTPVVENFRCRTDICIYIVTILIYYTVILLIALALYFLC